MLNPPYAIWSIWHVLALWYQLLFLALCVIGIYSLWSAVVTISRLRTFAKAPQKEDILSIQQSLLALRRRSAKLGQFIGAAFYLFGFELFWGLQLAYQYSINSKTPPTWAILTIFVTHFAFAANVFLVFLIIHFVRWFVADRIDAYASRLNTQPLA